MSKQKTIQQVGYRDSLPNRRAPYWHALSRGCRLGYRKMTDDGGGTWAARYSDPDTKKWQETSLGTFGELPPNERYDAAKQAAEAWFAHMGAGGRKEALTLADACNRYLESLRDEGRTAAAADAQGRFKRWVFGKPIGTVKLQKLTHAKLQDWRKALARTLTLPQDKAKQGTGTQRAASSVNRDLVAVRAALNLALRDRLVTNDAAWAVALLPASNANGRRTAYLDSLQRKALQDAATNEVRPFITALCWLPLRPGAMANLRVQDFDKRTNDLRIRDDKGRGERTIRLPPETGQFFAEQCRNKIAAAPIFARADGSAWSRHSWKLPVKAAVAGAGLPVDAVAYTLRHSAITDLVTHHGLDLMTVAILSGTSAAMIQKHYGHMVASRATAALAGLALA